MRVTAVPSRYTDGDGVCPSDAVACELFIILLLIENSRPCAGKWLYNNRLWSCSREFTTLKGIIVVGYLKAFVMTIRK